MTPANFKIPRPESDFGLAFDVIEVMWEFASFYEDEQTYRRSVAPATSGQLAIYACTWYLLEVDNGGHHQFFSNSTGMVWEEALSGLELSGATEHRRILSEVLTFFPASKPAKDRQHRSAQLEATDYERFEELDERLYHVEEDFDALAREHIREHPEDFFLEL